MSAKKALSNNNQKKQERKNKSATKKLSLEKEESFEAENKSHNPKSKKHVKFETSSRKKASSHSNKSNFKSKSDSNETSETKRKFNPDRLSRTRKETLGCFVVELNKSLENHFLSSYLEILQKLKAKSSKLRQLAKEKKLEEKIKEIQIVMSDFTRLIDEHHCCPVQTKEGSQSVPLTSIASWGDCTLKILATYSQGVEELQSIVSQT